MATSILHKIGYESGESDGKRKALWKNLPSELSILSYKPVQLLILVGSFCLVGFFGAFLLKNVTIS